MLWIYERSNETLRIETRFDNATAEYVLVIHWPDGREQVERFSNGENFQLRLDGLEQQLGTDEWQSRGVTLLRDGWKIA
jgi:hypothetical protein